MGESMTWFGESRGWMRRESPVQAETVVQHFSYLDVMHKEEGKNWGAYLKRIRAERRIPGPGQLSASFMSSRLDS